MINKILHLITNRANDFGPIFPISSSYIVQSETADEKMIRDLLQLRYSQNDYYVISALGAVYSFPEIAENFGQETRTFRLSDFRRPPDQWIGAALIPGDDPPAVCRHAMEFPVIFDIVFSFGDANNLRVQVGTQQYMIPARASGTTLYPIWPKELGIMGALDITGQAWTTGFSATLTHVPVSFPYKIVAGILDGNLEKNNLLLQTGLLEHYLKAGSGMEKMATVLLALGINQ